MECVNCSKCYRSMGKYEYSEYCALNENFYSPGYDSMYDGKTLVCTNEKEYEILCYKCMEKMIDSGELKIDSCSADAFIIQIPFDELDLSSMKRLKKLEDSLKYNLKTLQYFIGSNK